MAAHEAPVMPNSEPMRKPNLRPRRIISIEAGNTDSMTPRCCMVTGRFAHMRMSGGTMVSTASAEEANISVLLPWVSAWQNRQQADIAQRAARHAVRRWPAFPQPLSSRPLGAHHNRACCRAQAN